MMNWEELLAGIKAGRSVEDLTDALRSAPLQQVLRRAALVRSFDRDAFEHVLGRDVGEVDFTTLVGSDAVERLPQPPERYQLRRAIGSRLLSQWQSDPAGLRTVSAALAEYYQTRGPGDRYELLRQLAITDAGAARRLFDALFDEADARFDLARALEVIDALGDRLTLIPDELNAWRDDRRLYLEARGLFADDWYRTAHVLHRPPLTAAIDTLLGDTERWILQLHATGGMGKTMFLRDLIARRCVPARIPVARIDFDFEERGAQPWRLLVRLAEQLNRQTARAPFQDLVAKAREADALAAVDAAVHWQNLANDIPWWFTAILAELRLTSPVLIVVDTLEEALLHQGSDVLGLVDRLADVRARVPTLRLILSGRYDLLLESRLPGFATRYRAQTVDVPLTRLSGDESRRFLLDRRVADDDRLPVVVERAEGSPFKLALFADLLGVNPGLTAARIRAYPSADVTYLIERVVERIPDPRVRWLVRYGVVPRQLTFAFVRDVMARYVRLAISTTVPWDAPAADLPEALQSIDPFPSGFPGSDQLDLEALWGTLARYAETASWVTSSDATQTLVFHGDVVNPMRGLLRGHGIFEMLHRDAVAHDEKLANDDPQGRVRHLRNAVYHRFQLEGARAGQYWETLIMRARTEGDADLQRELADEVTGSEYVEDGRPRPWDERTPMIEPPTLARAYLEFAAAAVALPRTVDVAPGDWEKASRALAAAETIARRDGVPLPPARIAFVRAALQTNAADVDAALATLDAARALSQPALDRLDLETARGALLLAVQRPEAEEAFRAALEAAAEGAAPTATRVQLQIRLAAAQAGHGRLRAARETCLAVLASPDAGAGAAQVMLLLAQIELWRGRPSATVGMTFPEAAASGETRFFWGLRVFARCDQELPFQALEDLVSLREPRTDDERILAVMDEAAAAIDIALFRDTSALQVLDRARGGWSRTGSAEGVARMVRRCVELHARAGNLQGADLLLSEVRSLGLPSRSEGAVRLELVRAEILHRHGAVEEALKLPALSYNSADWPPIIRVWVAVANLELLPKAQRTGPRLRALVSTLVEALEEIDDAAARLRLLKRLERCPPVVGPGGIGRTSPLVRTLARLVRATTEPNDVLAPRDAALLTLRRAEVYRILGDRAAAGRALDEAETLLAADPVPLAMREVLLARDRLGWDSEGPPDRPSALERVLGYAGNYPTLLGVVALEQAERLERAGRHAGAQEWATSARGYLTEEGFTGWHARLDELVSVLSATTDPERAQALRQRAAATWERLGDLLASARAREESPATFRPEPPTPQAGVEEDTLVVRMVEESAMLRVDLDGTPVPPSLPERAIVDDLLGDRLDRAEAARREWIARLSRDWRRAAGDLRLLTGLASVGRGRATVRLEIGPLRLQELPWELMTVVEPAEPAPPLADVRVFYRSGPAPLAQSFVVGWVQRALSLVAGARLAADGIVGPLTRGALQDFQRATGLEATGTIDPLVRQALEARLRERPSRRPMVVMLRASREHAERDFRGLESLAAGVPFVYETLGQVVEIDDPRTFEKIPVAQAAIFHVTGRFHDSPSRGGVLADIGVGEPISVPRFDDLLRASRTPPLVILDATRPEGPSETLRQLFLRNAFAADLFARRRVAAVVATGLGDYARQRTMFSILGTLLGHHATLGEIAFELRRHADPPDLLEVLSSTGTALFAHDAELRPMLGAATS